MFDGYDTGIRDADGCLAALIESLTQLGVYDDTAVIISSDHGETLGELGIYCDHQTADEYTTRIPMIIRWPGSGIPGRVDGGLCYQIDVAATVLELLGAQVPDGWDGRSSAVAFRDGGSSGRDHLVLSQAAWCAQRAVRFGDWLYIATYHDGFPRVP
jgi:choline-sulfatase